MKDQHKILKFELSLRTHPSFLTKTAPKFFVWLNEMLGCEASWYQNCNVSLLIPLNYDTRAGFKQECDYYNQHK